MPTPKFSLFLSSIVIRLIIFTAQGHVFIASPGILLYAFSCQIFFFTFACARLPLVSSSVAASTPAARRVFFSPDRWSLSPALLCRARCLLLCCTPSCPCSSLSSQPWSSLRPPIPLVGTMLDLMLWVLLGPRARQMPCCRSCSASRDAGHDAPRLHHALATTFF